MLDNAHSLAAFSPELVLAATVLVVLALDLAPWRAGRLGINRVAAISVGGIAVATVATLATAHQARALFFELIARDPFADFWKLFFLLTAALVAFLSLRAGDAIDESAAEFYALVLTTTIGMMLMAAAIDLLTAYLSLETVSIMSYVLAGFRRRSRQSAEAALKYVIYGGVASGVMLYGMSLLYGLAGSTGYAAILQAAGTTSSPVTVVLAVVLCLAGFGYKVAAVPFHMWCPDVYEGAPTAVTAFLSVGPKAAGFALLLRFCAGVLPAELGGVRAPWPLLFALVAAATMTLGNLAALSQTNIKRLLAYSSIAHAGYVLLALVAGGHDGAQAILLYLVAYLFMSLGAFAVVIAVAERGVGDELGGWRGLGKRAPLAAAAMAIFLFSLTGLPPFAGFFAKFYVFY
ncbi:MAG: nuoN, partial [bacterium]|nr:nuoN [bacterium]